MNYTIKEEACSILLAALQKGYKELAVSLIDVIVSETGLDPNMQSYNVRTRGMTAAHLLVITNDY